MHRLSAYAIVRRTRTDWVANAIRLDGERNPIGRRTETVGGAAVSAAPTKQTGNLLQLSQLHQPSKLAIYSSCLHCTNQANWQSIAAVSTAPTKQTGNLLQLSQLGFAACQSKNCTNQAIKPTILM